MLRYNKLLNIQLSGNQAQPYDKLPSQKDLKSISNATKFK